MPPAPSSAPSVDRWLDAAGRVPLLTAAQETQLGRVIQAWLQHPDGPDDCPPAARRRGLRARDRMVAANLRLVATVARRRWSPSGSRLLEDVLQDGTLGLVRAAEKFDPARGYKFSTYAYWWILQAINKSRARDRLIPMPDARWVDSFDPAKDDPHTLAARAALRVGSLDMPLQVDGSDSAPLAELLEGGSLIADNLQWPAALEVVRESLSPDEWAVLTLKVEGATHADLADLTGCSRDVVGVQLRELKASVRGLPEVAAALAG